MEDGRWKMEDGRWKMEDGRWKMIKLLNNKIGFISIFIISAFIIIMRRPDIITNAVPWAEDGKVWLSQAHNIGFKSLFMVQDGYMQTISRLAYFIGELFGLYHAPLIATIISIALRCSMCAFFMSSRFSFISYKIRLAILAYFLFMPNIYEGYVNITNAQWYLSLYAIGVILAEKNHSKVWNLHDIVVLVISGLSGPFVLFLLPAIFFKHSINFIKTRDFRNLLHIELFIVCICFIVQTLALLSGFDSRSKAPLGASIPLLADIFAMRILFGSFIDNKFMEFITNFHAINIISMILYCIMILFIFTKGGWRARSLVAFATLMLASSLYRPMMSLHSDQWPIFIKPGAGERYFFIINFLFFCSIAYILNYFSKDNEKIVVVCLLMLCFPTIYSFEIYKVPSANYALELKKYDSAKIGEKVNIRIAPPGWDMTIEKK